MPTILPVHKLVSVPLQVNVALIGFAADGAWQLELDAGELRGLLDRFMPQRTPSCGSEAAPLDVVFDIEYNVVTGHPGLAELDSRLAKAMRASSVSSDEYEVHVEDVEDYFDSLANSLAFTARSEGVAPRSLGHATCAPSLSQAP